jgi:valyl-tRNA synthetase
VRELLVEELKKMGMYRGKTPNKMALALCSRSNDVIEPVMRPQWFAF